MRLRTSAKGVPELAGNTILALLGFALPYYLLYRQPVGYVYYITEDYWIQYATFVSMAMASGILAWTLATHRDARTPGIILLALGAFFNAMEEISWGQRILGYQSPGFFAKHNLQGEMTLHNLFPNPSSGFSKVGIAVFLWSIVLPLLTARSKRLQHWCSRLGVPIVPLGLRPLFLLASYFFISGLPYRKQIGEGYLGIAIAALSLDLALTARRGSPPQGVGAATGTAAMIAAVWILTAGLVQFYPMPKGIRDILNQLAGTILPARGMYRQSEMLFDYINRNPRFLKQRTHLSQGSLLMRMGRTAEAKEVLELALAEQERLRRRNPNDPGPDRYAGEALTLLARPREAEQAFQAAIEKDRARLGRAHDAASKAWIHRSLGQTLYAMGDSDAAFNHFSMARAMAPDQKTRYRVGRVVLWSPQKGAPASAVLDLRPESEELQAVTD